MWIRAHYFNRVVNDFHPRFIRMKGVEVYWIWSHIQIRFRENYLKATEPFRIFNDYVSIPFLPFR